MPVVLGSDPKVTTLPNTDACSTLDALISSPCTAYQYTWQDPGPVPSLNGADFFANQNLNVGDEITVIGDNDIVNLVVTQSDAINGPIVKEVHRTTR